MESEKAETLKVNRQVENVCSRKKTCSISLHRSARFIFYLCPFSYHFAWFLTFHFHLQSLPWPAWKWTAADRSHSQSRPDPALFATCKRLSAHTHTHRHTQSNATMRKLQVWQAKQQKKKETTRNKSKGATCTKGNPKRDQRKFSRGHLSFDYRPTSTSLWLSAVQTFSLRHFSISMGCR